jgi:putative nucleotidyltransferase with HDIG domain
VIPRARKKLGVDELQLGMYVTELDRPWKESKFMFQGFEIRTLDELTELRRLCQHVFIEVDIPQHNAQRHTAAAAPPAALSLTDAAAPRPRRIGYEILDRLVGKRTQPPRYADRTSVEEEMPAAEALRAQTRELIDGFWEDARLGRSLDIPGARETVANIVQSVLRNPDALLWLNELKNQDAYTALHSLRVCVLALAFGRHLELDEAGLNMLGLGALLHDVGKTKVPLDILNKPGSLTPAESELMRAHVPHGVALLEGARNVPAEAVEVVKWHHERFDGSGYAFGLHGDQISLFGQIGAIVDTYDAITSDRCYHRGMSAHDALRKMYEWRRKDFHDRLVEQFIQCMGVYPLGSIVELSTGSIGVVISANRLRRLRPRVALVRDPNKRKFMGSKVIDLMQEEQFGQSRVEIRNVLPAGSFGINPLDYLPHHH